MKQETVLNATKYFHDHKEHVLSLIKDCTTCYEPSSEDKNDPKLWKPAHWVHFLDTYRLYPKQYTKEQAKKILSKIEITKWLSLKNLLQLLYIEIFKPVKFNMFISLVDKGMFIGFALEEARKFKF